ncbi:MAG: hypothetical protein WBD20_04890 [Pirellulaceae bacterium]
MRFIVPTLLLSLCLPLAHADEVLLEDYQYGGCFSVADWANTFEDAQGRANEAIVSSKVARVSWGTKWSGIPSSGETQDFSKFKTFQVDVMVEKGQPVEEEANFYFQLLNESGTGYSYWEVFAPQTSVPADGKWYRIQLPIKSMVTGNGDGGEAPKDFTTINGTCCGMTFDENGDKFKFKRAFFDNVKLSTESVEKLTVSETPQDKEKEKSADAVESK